MSSIMNYLIDSYTIYAASVLAANSVLRSTFGAVFPLFTTYMYDNLGIHWASSIPAFLALACVPFPFLFYTYGPRIRKTCKYSREAEEAMDKITRQSALPEGAEKELRRVETNRSNIVREQTNVSKQQAEGKVGLDEADGKNVEQNDVPPVPSLPYAHEADGKEAADVHMPEGLEKDAENGGIPPEEV